MAAATLSPLGAPEVRLLNEQVAVHRTRQSYETSDIRLKIAIVGPVKCGKTRLSNQITGHPLLGVLDTGHQYHPTKGVRVSEFDTVVNTKAPAQSQPSTGASVLVSVQVSVELWDVSGSSEFEAQWPAVYHGLDGLVIVYEPQSSQSGAELKVWAEHFVREANLSDGQVLVLATNFADSQAQSLMKLGASVKFSIKGAAESDGSRTVTAPIVNLGNAAHPTATDANCPARREFDGWLGAVYQRSDRAMQREREP